MRNFRLLAGVAMAHGVLGWWLLAPADHPAAPLPVTDGSPLRVAIAPTEQAKPAAIARQTRAAQTLAPAPAALATTAAAEATPSATSPPLPDRQRASESALPERTVAASAAQPAASGPAQSEPRFDAAYLQNPAPAYPPQARRAREEGTVILQVFVAPDGLPGRIEIALSAGAERLDQAALAAVRQWKFVPAMRNQEAIGAWVRIPIVFSLKG